jgi:hypothetical protein
MCDILLCDFDAGGSMLCECFTENLLLADLNATVKVKVKVNFICFKSCKHAEFFFALERKK